MMRILAPAAIAIFALLPAWAAETPTQSIAAELARSALKTHELPAIAVHIQQDGAPVAQVALGVRKIGAQTPVGPRDLWHIGSCAKAMTSTMLMRLAERGSLGLDDKMAALFPEIAAKMDPALRDASLAQMLSHTAGLGDIQSEEELNALKAELAGAITPAGQRLAVAKHFLTIAPVIPPGTKFKYSNIGYVIAVAAAEARTKHPYEELMRRDVFGPLHMKSAAFGVPGHSGKIDEPLGHIAHAGSLTPVDPENVDAVLPSWLAPAGGAYMSLNDWARFVQDQVDGALGKGRLLRAESYRRLQTPVEPSKVYGLGWGAKLGTDGVPLMLTHNGSTDPWYAEVRAYPKSNLITLVATNRGDDDGGGAAVKEVGKGLAERLNPIR